jgi:hypothetical protein
VGILDTSHLPTNPPPPKDSVSGDVICSSRSESALSIRGCDCATRRATLGSEHTPKLACVVLCYHFFLKDSSSTYSAWAYIMMPVALQRYLSSLYVGSTIVELPPLSIYLRASTTLWAVGEDPILPLDIPSLIRTGTLQRLGTVSARRTACC